MSMNMFAQEVAIDNEEKERKVLHSIELQADKTLPEVRFTTIGASVAAGASFYRSTPTGDLTRFFTRIGLNFDIPIGQIFSIEPELLFGTRGGGFKMEEFKYEDIYNPQRVATGECEYEDRLFYADVPINVKLSKRMKLFGQTGRGFVSAGPVISMGMGGKGKAKALNYETGFYTDKEYKPMQNDVDNELADALYTNFEFSGNFRLGYDTDKGISVAIGYQMGLTDLVNGSMDDNCEDYYKHFYKNKLPQLHNNALYLQVGYRW